MDIILIAVEFGNHKIRSSRVLYSVLVKVGFSVGFISYIGLPRIALKTFTI